MKSHYPRVASLKKVERLREHLDSLGCPLPCDDAIEAAPTSPLAQPLPLAAEGRATILANRFVVQPMEGWDATREGRPSDLTHRRWQRFGASGAAWIWGGEAMAVQAEGRANPNQLVLSEANAESIGGLRKTLLTAAEERGERPFVGLQLTHSGRWSRPQPEGRAPRLAYRHPLLDPRVGVESDDAVLGDEEIERLIEDFARAAGLAQELGFDFVDVKHCHGYLLHEFLSARSRPGPWGGPSLEDRTRLVFALLDAVRSRAPGLPIGIRLSVFDAVPHRPERGEGEADARLGPGVPEAHASPYEWGFGVDAQAPERWDLSEPVALVERLVAAGVGWINVSAGSPYSVPHLQRPAAFPPSDGYAAPEDPLCGVARLLRAAREIKRAVPEAVVVSSGWTYLQEFLPQVAQACVREGWFDAVGLGRMVLSYPELPIDALAGRDPKRGLICRTFSDCTTAPRNGLVSGCYPLDAFYRERPERERLEACKRAAPGGAKA